MTFLSLLLLAGSGAAFRAGPPPPPTSPPTPTRTYSPPSALAAAAAAAGGKMAEMGTATPPPDRSFPHFWVRRKDGMWTVKPRQQRRQKRPPRPAPPTSTSTSKETTLSEHLSDAVRANPDLDDLADIVSAIRDGCVEISDMIGRASLDGHTGYLHDDGDGGDDSGGESEKINVQGERQKKLDVMGNEALKGALRRCGKVSYAISEEDEHEIMYPPSDTRREREYVVAFDPLDGSSNVDAGIPVGTIFGVYEKRKGTEGISSGDIVAAGYCFYSSATSFVFSFGKGADSEGGVHGFTLDRRDGEFKMTHPDIRIPSRGSVVSFNEANRDGWDRPMREYVSSVQAGAGETGKRYSSRYVGSMVGDVHRTLLSGGVFGYPADDRNPDGKLRLLYEAAPMAFLVEEAGGTAVATCGGGGRPVVRLDGGGGARPDPIHARSPCIMGSRDDLAEIRNHYRKGEDLASAERLSERLDEYLAELETFMSR